MSQASYDIQGSDGVKNTLKTNIDSYFDAILTKNSGNSAPSVTKAFMWWADTANGLLKRRDSTNENWLTICRLDDIGGLRTNAGDPNEAVTGLYEGERLFDTTNNIDYFYSGASTTWFRENQYTSKTVDYTLQINDRYVELGSGAAANRTFTLPAAASMPGKTYTVKNKTTLYTLTLDGNGSETIDGLTTYIIIPGSSVTFYSDGSNWQIAAIYNPAFLRLSAGNGRGSTNTAIRRFTTIVEDKSFEVFTYADSATLGATFTINQGGLYGISYTDGAAAALSRFGVSRNSSQLTTGIDSITDTNRLGNVLLGTGQINSVSIAGIRLNATDVIRAHVALAAPPSFTGASQTVFTIAYLGL